MRVAWTLIAVTAAVGLVVPAGASAAGRGTVLRIAYYEDHASPETRIVHTLRCGPAAGTHPRRTAACRELARLGVRSLQPVPPRTACTEIFGGAMVAFVTGTVDSRRVWVKLRRDDGCEIDRWNRNWFLVPSDVVR
jgi:hypothetical protein